LEGILRMAVVGEVETGWKVTLTWQVWLAERLFATHVFLVMANEESPFNEIVPVVRGFLPVFFTEKVAVFFCLSFTVP
jgi:hypothetical protein